MVLGESSSVFCFLAHCEETRKTKTSVSARQKQWKHGLLTPPTPPSPPRLSITMGGVEVLVTSNPTHSHYPTQPYRPVLDRGSAEFPALNESGFLVFGAATKCAMCSVACFLDKLQKKLFCCPLYKLCA